MNEDQLDLNNNSLVLLYIYCKCIQTPQGIAKLQNYNIDTK